MKLIDLLKKENSSNLILLTDDADLNKEIRYVESTETPDVNMFIEENSMVITTAMYFENDQKGLLKFIDSLVEKNSVALAIKVDRFLKQLDPCVIDHANKLRFPILEIPKTMTLGNLYSNIIKDIFSSSEDSLTYILNSQKIFSNMLLQKPNLTSILNTLKNITGIEVGLIDPFGNIESSTPLFKSLFDKNITRSLIKNLDSNIPSVYEKNIKDKYNVVRKSYIYKIHITSYYPYYLVVLDSKEVDIEKTHFIIEQANYSILHTLSRDLNQKFFELQKYYLLFQEMLSMDPNNMIKQSYQLPEKIYTSGRLALISLPNYEELFPKHMRSEGYTLIYNWIENKISDEDNYIVIPMEKDFYYLIMTSEKEIDKIIRNLIRVSNGLIDSLQFKTQITIGPSYYSIDYLKQSYNETIDSVELGVSHPKYANINIASPHSYKSLFAHIPEEQKKYFCQSTLKKLYDTNNKQHEELRDTLKVWLDKNCNISDTAEELFVHRNTVSYRINKCKEILDSSLEDPEELFNLRVAFYLI